MSRNKLPALTALLQNPAVQHTELVTRLEPYDALDPSALHPPGEDGPAQAEFIAAACQRIAMLMSGADTDAATEMALIKSVLHLMPPEIGTHSASALVAQGYPHMLSQILDALAANHEVLHQPEAQAVLGLALQSVADMCASSAKVTPPPLEGAPAGLKVRAAPLRDLLGELFVPRIAEFVPSTRYYPIRIRRQAAATLLDLVTNSKANQRTLAALPAPTVDRAFGDFLGAAADYATQLDLLEVLFRVARTAAPALPRRVLPSPAAEALETVTAAFDAAAAAAAGKGGAAASDLDLAAELRVVLLALNQHLGDGASVFSYSMTSLEVVGVPGVHCSDPWVDLTAPSGQGGYPGHMSCSVTVPDPDLEPGEEPPPELLTVPYSDMARVTLRDSRSDASQCEVEVALARLPEALEAALHTDESGAVDATGAAAGGAAGGSGPRVALVLVLGKEAANRMLHHVPKRLRGVLTVATEDPLFFELSQHQPAAGTKFPKMSRGLSVYQAAPRTAAQQLQQEQQQQQQQQQQQNNVGFGYDGPVRGDTEGGITGATTALTAAAGTTGNDPAATEGGGVGEGMQNGGHGHGEAHSGSGVAGRGRAAESHPANSLAAEEEAEEEEGHEVARANGVASGKEHQQAQQREQKPVVSAPAPAKTASKGHAGSEAKGAASGAAASGKPSAAGKAAGSAGEGGAKAARSGPSAPPPATSGAGARAEKAPAPAPARAPAPTDAGAGAGGSKRSEEAAAAAKPAAAPAAAKKGKEEPKKAQEPEEAAGKDKPAPKAAAPGKGKAAAAAAKGKENAAPEAVAAPAAEPVAKAPAAPKDAPAAAPAGGPGAAKGAAAAAAGAGSTTGARKRPVPVAAAPQSGDGKQPVARPRAERKGADDDMGKTPEKKKRPAPAAAAAADAEAAAEQPVGKKPRQQTQQPSAATAPSKEPPRGATAADRAPQRPAPSPSPGPQSTGAGRTTSVTKTFRPRKTPTPSFVSGGAATGAAGTGAPSASRLTGTAATGTAAAKAINAADDKAAGKAKAASAGPAAPDKAAAGEKAKGKAKGAETPAAAAGRPGKKAPETANGQLQTPVGKAAAAAPADAPGMAGRAAGPAPSDSRGGSAGARPGKPPTAPPSSVAAAPMARAAPRGGPAGAAGKKPPPGPQHPLGPPRPRPPAAAASPGGPTKYSLDPIEDPDTPADREHAGVGGGQRRRRPASQPQEPPEGGEAGLGAEAGAEERAGAGLKEPAVAPAGVGGAAGAGAGAAGVQEAAGAMDGADEDDVTGFDGYDNRTGTAGRASNAPLLDDTAASPKEPAGRATGSVAGNKGKQPAAAGGRATGPGGAKRLRALAEGPINETGGAAPAAAEGAAAPAPKRQRKAAGGGKGQGQETLMQQQQLQQQQPQAAARPGRQAKAKAMEALAGQLAPTQPSPTQKQRQEQQARQAPHKQPAAEAAAAPPLQQRGKQPAAQQAAAALLPPAALLRGADVQLESEAELDVVFATDDVVPATEPEEYVYGDAAAARTAAGLRQLYADVDAEELPAEQEDEQEDAEHRSIAAAGAAGAAALRTGRAGRKQLTTIEGDLLLGEDPGRVKQRQQQPLVVDVEHPGVRLGGAAGAGLYGDDFGAGGEYGVGDLFGSEEGGGGFEAGDALNTADEPAMQVLLPSPAKSVSPVLPKAAGAPKRATGPSPAARRELLPPPGSARRGTAAAAPTSVPPHGAAGTAAGLGELPALVGLSAPPGVGKPPRGGTKATAAAPAAALPPLSRSRLGGGASSAGGVTGSRLGGALQPLGFVDEGLGGLDGDGDGGLGALGGERDAKRLNFGTGGKLNALKPLPFMSGIRSTPGGTALPSPHAFADTLAAAGAGARAGGAAAGGGRRRAAAAATKPAARTGRQATGTRGRGGRGMADECVGSPEGEPDITALASALLRGLGGGGGGGGGGGMAALLGGDEAEEGEDEEGEGELGTQLQALLAGVVKRKRQKAMDQQAAIMRDIQQRIEAEARELEAAIGRDATQVANTARRAMAQLQNQLSERLAAIETLHARHNAELSAAWTDYADLYGQAEAVKQEMATLVEQRQRDCGRRVAALQQRAQQLLAEAEARAARARSGASKMPELAGLLATLMAS